MSTSANAAARQNDALVFASAISRDGIARVLDAANNGGPEMPLDEAISAWKPFTVQFAARIYMIDIDSDDDRAWAGDVRDGLSSLGFEFVVTSSGRPGNGHMYILTPPGWEREALKEQITKVAGPARSEEGWRQLRSSGRTPYAPHRWHQDGVPPSTIVEPASEEALDLFQKHRFRGDPLVARRALVWLDPTSVQRVEDGRVDRGRAIRAAAISLVNAGGCWRDLERMLKDNKNEVTSKYWKKPFGIREAYAKEVWRSASSFVRDNPPRGVAGEQIQALRGAIPAGAWSPTTAGTDLRVYRALLDIGENAAKLEIRASQRDLSKRANLARGSVYDALKRLAIMQLIDPVEEPDRPIHLPKAYRLRTDSLPKTSALSPITTVPRGTTSVWSNEHRFLRDIFGGSPGLDHKVEETWRQLSDEPKRAKEVRESHPVTLTQATILRHLNRLKKEGLAERQGNSWTVLVPSVDELAKIADRLGVNGKARRREEHSAREQGAFRAVTGARYDSQPSDGADRTPASD